MTNWKRGISRIYIVLWGIWALGLVVVVTPMLLMGRVWPALTVLGLWGLVFPGCVLIGVRWAIDGFVVKSG
jgi:hypothetical protein